MRGHEALIELRAAKRRPAHVIVTVGTDLERGWKWWPAAGQPEVEIEPADNIGKLDLRWVSGLTLAVVGESERRTLEFVVAAERWRPAHIFALMNDDDSVVEYHRAA